MLPISIERFESGGRDSRVTSPTCALPSHAPAHSLTRRVRAQRHLGRYELGHRADAESIVGPHVELVNP